MTHPDPLTALGLEPGDLLAAAACMHNQRPPHLRAVVARLAEAEHRGALARNPIEVTEPTVAEGDPE